MKNKAFKNKPSSRRISVRDIGCFVIPRTKTLRGDGASVRAFTLIELLVVVLIIGILAAIALPGYQKAVEKSRLSEVLLRTSALEKAIDIYIMENGWQDGLSFFGGSADDVLSIDVKSGLEDLAEEHIYNSHSKYYDYQAYCIARGGEYTGGSSSCHWTVTKLDRSLYLYGERSDASNGWQHFCEYDDEDSVATGLCKSLQAQGWQQGDLYF